MSPRMLQATTRYHLAAVGVAALVCFVTWPEGALALLTGGLLMALNFWALRVMMLRLLSDAEKRTKLLFAALLAFKLFAVMGLMAVSVLAFDLNPVGLALGLATLFVGLAFAVVHETLRQPVQPT